MRFGNAQGFSLIEVLMALMIIAIVGLSSHSVLSQLADQRFMLANRGSADELAWNLAVRALTFPNELSETHLDYAGRSWIISSSVEPTVLGTLERLELRVTRTDGEGGVSQLVYYTAK